MNLLFDTVEDYLPTWQEVPPLTALLLTEVDDLLLRSRKTVREVLQHSEEASFVGYERRRLSNTAVRWVLVGNGAAVPMLDADDVTWEKIGDVNDKTHIIRLVIYGDGGVPIVTYGMDVWLDGTDLTLVFGEYGLLVSSNLIHLTVGDAPKYAPGFPSNVLTRLQEAVPGLTSYADCPLCEDPGDETIAQVVMHLNDVHQLPREKIADWLDALGVDLTFSTEERKEETCLTVP